MDFNFFGSLDILFVILALGTLFVGYKSGFLMALVRIAGTVFGLFMAVFLAQPLANILKNLNIGIRLRERVEAYLISKSPEISEAIIGDPQVVQENVSSLGFPKFITNFLVKRIEDLGPQAVEAGLLKHISPIITNFFLIIIAFLMLFIGAKILFFILKILVIYFRELPFVKILDGIFGMIFYSLVFMLVIFILLFVLKQSIINNILPENIYTFFITDLQLDTEKFRLLKWLYNNNFIADLYEIFF